MGAIVLFGGIGLLLAQAVVSPGLLSRGESLKRAGSDAGRTCLGAGAMLVLAAIVESYLRQSHLSTAGRLAFAAGSVLFWTLFIVHGFVREHHHLQHIPLPQLDESVEQRDGQAARLDVEHLHTASLQRAQGLIPLA